MTLRIAVRGKSHLAQTLTRAARMHGFLIVEGTPELVFAAEDVLDHSDLAEAHVWFKHAVGSTGGLVVLVSQVPPGTTRKWAGADAPWIFYQVDTIIVRTALSRAVHPEQIVVGCADPAVPLPLAYQEYLMAHDCPVRQVPYETAELAKCAINYVLAKQIEAANHLAAAARAVGADYEDVEVVLRNDARIGPCAYVHPGLTNQHLDRDVKTVLALAAEATTSWRMNPPDHD